MLSHHILMNIISMDCYNYFVTKRSLNNALYRKFSLNCKQHLKTRKEHVEIKCFFNKVLTISLYCKDMVEPYYIKGVQKQLFTYVLQNRCSWKFCKIHRKTPMLELIFNKLAHVLSFDLCEIFKKTYFLINPQNKTLFLRKQIRKVT